MKPMFFTLSSKDSGIIADGKTKECESEVGESIRKHWTQQGNCTYELIAVTVACRRPMKSKARTKPAQRGKGVRHEAPSPAEELLAVVVCLERKRWLSLRV